jgi:crotonobetainyl-CoA:carnitine CoA-transferase CaiB-like acyl-CoA transferase
MADDGPRLDIPTGKINSIDDLLEDPQFKASDLFAEHEHQTERRYVEARTLVRLSAAPLKVTLACCAQRSAFQRNGTRSGSA